MENAASSILYAQGLKTAPAAENAGSVQRYAFSGQPTCGGWKKEGV
jgi:hypothetical protein